MGDASCSLPEETFCLCTTRDCAGPHYRGYGPAGWPSFGQEKVTKENTNQTKLN